LVQRVSHRLCTFSPRLSGLDLMQRTVLVFGFWYFQLDDPKMYKFSGSSWKNSICIEKCILNFWLRPTLRCVTLVDISRCKIRAAPPTPRPTIMDVKGTYRMCRCVQGVDLSQNVGAEMFTICDKRRFGSEIFLNFSSALMQCVETAAIYDRRAPPVLPYHSRWP